MNKPKIYVMCDIEGVSGVAGREYIVAAAGPRSRRQGPRLYGAENQCLRRGVRSGGAGEIIVVDCHGGGLNVTRDLIDDRADLIVGDIPRRRFADIEGAAGLILLGCHAKAGTLHAVLEHTMSSTGFQNIWINDKSAGEVAIDAVIAAEYAVPVIMVSGGEIYPTTYERLP